MALTKQVWWGGPVDWAAPPQFSDSNLEGRTDMQAPTQAPVQSQTARSYNTTVAGRCIGSSGSHHWVMDYAPHQEGPGEMPGPTEYFLSGVSSCGVLMIQREAGHRGIALESIDVHIEAFRHTDGVDRRHNTFARVTMDFKLVGPNDAEAKDLIAHYQKNCPLYGSVAEATGDIDVTFTIRPRS